MAEQNNKRKRSESDCNDIALNGREIAADGRPKLFKQACMASGSISHQPAAPQFQLFHLGILRSLYESDDNDIGDVNDDDDDDDDAYDDGSDCSLGESVTDRISDDNIWVATTNFLREREHLTHQKKDASQLKDIHQEALNFMFEQESHCLSPSSPNTVTSSTWHWSSKSIAANAGFHSASNSIASPYSLGFFSPQKSVAVAPAQSLQHDDNGVCNKAPVKCFGLVGKILERRFQAFASAVRRQSDPYEPVLKQIEVKIGQLESKLERIHEDSLANQKQTMEDLLSGPVILASLNAAAAAAGVASPANGWTSNNSRHRANCSLSKLQTKLSLWKMLAADLRDVVADVQK